MAQGITRERLIEIIGSKANTELTEEIEHHLSIDREEEDEEADAAEGIMPYDTVWAFFDAYERFEDDGNTKMIRLCRDILIEAGFYRVMPDDEIANTVVSRGTPWSFKRQGVAYTTDFNTSSWQAGHSGWNAVR